MSEYFEEQSERNCTIHSFNNAFGRKILDKVDVLAFIDVEARKLRSSLEDMGMDAFQIEKEVNRYKHNSSTGGTNFKASEVWSAGKILKQSHYGYVPLPAVRTPVLDINPILNSPEVSSRPIVVLGSIYDNPHAIAIRDGRIYDSESHPTVYDLTRENLLKCLDKIVGAYVFVEDRSTMAALNKSLRSVLIINNYYK